ncbi:MAG: copper-binding protein [Methylibium sp.]|uniref:copper-binding protein n=1 Tax=Methylibium sp. TaxID=2067992 RepID=UPI001819ECE5|nr:copper-binding protein [Methylibium sp.]MBA3598917.1 copper-binding protein [Methylibium sp.]
MKRTILAGLALACIPLLGHAQATTDAEVRKVDAARGKITLKHGEIKNLDMPAMSMVFAVRDAAMLTRVQPGDKVHFTADKIKGIYTVTSIEIRK